VISGTTARWILDCGASTHVSNGEGAVSSRIPIEEPTAILTADGVKSLLDSVIVSIPCIEGLRSAVVAERSPNLASMGKLIMEDGYRVREWSQNGGLQFVDPSGVIVPTFIEDFVPFLGTLETDEDNYETLLVNPAKDAAVDTVSDAEELLRQVVDDSVDHLSAVLAEYVETLISNAKEDSIDVEPGLSEPVTKKRLSSPRLFPTELEKDATWAESSPSTAPVQRKHNPISGLDQTREDEIPVLHLYSHMFKNKFCFGCEFGKMKRAPSYRQISKPEVEIEAFLSTVSVFCDAVSEVLGLAADVVQSDVLVDVPGASDDVSMDDGAPAKEELPPANAVPDPDPVPDKEEPIVPSAPGPPLAFSFDEVEPLTVPRRYCRKVFLDLVGPTIESVRGFTGVAVGRDRDTNTPEVGLLVDKRPESILAWWREAYPGNALQGTSPAIVFCDHGGEFQGAFREYVMAQGGSVLNSLPEKPQGNSVEERFHDSLTRCVRASLKFANVPVKFWCYCVVLVVFNLGRTPDGRKDGKTPRERKVNRPHTETLVPFACRAVFYDESSSKFAPKGIEGVVLGYGVSGGYVIMNFKEYVQSRGSVVTRRPVIANCLCASFRFVS
jgi:hypothetical protein